MVEEMNLVVLRCAQYGRADEDRGDIERDAGQAHHEKYRQDREQRRNHRHQTGGGAAKHEQKREKNHACRQCETLGERRQQPLCDLCTEHTLADHSAMGGAQRRLVSLGRCPLPLDESAHRTDAPEELGAPTDAEAYVGKILHIDVLARSRRRQQDLLEIRRESRPRRRRRGQLIGSGFDVPRPPQHRGWPVDGRDARIAFEPVRQLLQGAQETGVQCVAGRRLHPKLDDVEPVGLLEFSGILGHALAGIDVGQHVHFESQGRGHSGNAEQCRRSAQHQ